MSEIYDLAIIGGGPAALTAAIYAGRENMKTVMIERAVIGGLMATIDKIENYPGFPDGVSGMVLAEQFDSQRERFGAELKIGEATKISQNSANFQIALDSDESVATRAILVATGNDYKKIGRNNIDDFAHYCATCDGAFFQGQALLVVGGGNAAVQEAMFLTNFAKKITLLVRSEIKATPILQDRLKKFVDAGKISLKIGWEIEEILTDENGAMTGAKIFAKNNAAHEEIAAGGLFVFIGMRPRTEFLGDFVARDQWNYIKTDAKNITKTPGIFAAGDVRSGATRQVASAVGDGATAIFGIRDFLAEKDS